MNRSRGMLVLLLPLALVFGSVATVSAVILIVVVSLLTLFAIVGACDVVISVLDERGDILDTRQFFNVAPGEMVSLQYRSRAEPGGTEPIRATVRSRTVPRSPHPPGPCPILARLQVVDGTSGRTEAMMMPASQQVVRETTPGPAVAGAVWAATRPIIQTVLRLRG